ncbi:fimbrial protein [Serratia sp. D1N4]
MRLWQQVITALLLLTGSTVNAADTVLGGVPINITLTNLVQITVEKPGGGWYDTLTLSNSAGSDITRYQVQVPVQVSIRNGQDFMVSLVNPLVLTHETDTALTFTTEQVGFGSNATTQKLLNSTPVDFSNPPQVGGTSTGSYLLSVSARQPVGVLGNVSGSYAGKLVMMFEVKV